MSEPPIRRREDWGTATAVDEGLWRIRLFNPNGPLMVNTYVHVTGDTLAVIDVGWPWTLDAFEEALRDLGLARGLEDVTHWLYTHTHIDHMGPAALLAERSDAPHITWSGTEELLGAWHAYQYRVNDWTPWTKEAFAPPARDRLAKAYRRRLEERDRQFMIDQHGEMAVRNTELYEFGETVEVGELRLEIHDARGHDPYHIAFFERERGWLFIGDAVIATPTPICRAMGDDLKLYREALERLADLPANTILPGHGIHRSGDLKRLFERSKGYVEQYRQETLQALEETENPVDLLTLGLSMTPDGKPLTPSGRWWVHIALIDSHLCQLVDEGLVSRHTGPRYRRR